MLDRVRFLGLVVVGLGLAVACSRSGMEDLYAVPEGGIPLPEAGLGGSGGAGTGGAAPDSGPELGGTGGGGFGGTGAVGGFGGFGGGGFGGTGAVGGFGGFGGGGFGGTGAVGGFGGGGFGGGGFGGGGFGGGGFGGTGAVGGFGGFGGGPVDAGPTGGSGGTGGSPTDGGNFFDAFPFPDSGPIGNCLSCADQSCNSQVNACYNNPACASGVVCALTSCFGGGGGLNFSCVIGCFGGNFSAAGQALQAFLCVSNNCGQQCVGAITGGGGTPGGGTPGGGGGPVPPAPPPGGVPASFSPVAGGYLLTVPADKAPALGVPAGTMYVPPLEVLDGVTPTCGGKSGACR